jgi:hypothetical protein
MIFLKFFLGVVGVLWATIGLGAGYYPFPVSESFVLPPGMEKWKLVKSLNGKWSDETGRLIQVPFWDTESKSITLTCYFDYDTLELPELQLYFEGLSGTSEIFLNNQLLMVWNQPFQPLVLPLSDVRLKRFANKLIVHLQNPPNFTPGAPNLGLGIHRPAGILTRGESSRTLGISTAPFADSVIVFAPWSRQYHFNITPLQLEEYLKKLDSLQVKHLWFPIPPSATVTQVLASAGFKRVWNLSKAHHVFWYNTWPVIPGGKGEPEVGWINTEEKTGAFFKGWTSPDAFTNCYKSRDNLTLLTLLLFPLLGVVLVRLLNPQILFRQFQWLFARKNRPEVSHPNRFLKTGEAWVATLAALMISSTFLTNAILYLQLECRLDSLGSGMGFQLVNRLIAHPFQFMITLMGIQLGALAIKLFLAGVVAGIYRKAYLRQTLLNAFIQSHYPLNLLLCVLSLYLFYVPAFGGNVLWSIWLILCIVFFFRGLWIIWERLYIHTRFPPFLIFLYICTFEILPWLLAL